MQLNFKNLKIRNFLSFDYAEIDLSKMGYILINGINNNNQDNAKSNGSGKSTIFEALVWCLTGETIRGTKQIVNQFTTGGTCVELVFNVGNDEYIVSRYKDDDKLGTNLRIQLNGKDISGKGIRDSEKILEEYLPDLTASLLGSVIILGQGLPQRFTNNTPSGRKEVLEKLTKSDFMIDDIKQKLSERKSTLSTQLRQLEDIILSDASKEETLEQQLVKLKEDKTLLDCNVDYESEIKKYEKILDELESNQVDAYHYSQQLNEQLNNKLKEYQDWVSKSNQNFLYEKSLLEETLSPYTQKVNSLRVELELKDKEIKRLESIVDVCPTCGQHLPDVHKVDTTQLKEEKDKLAKGLSEQTDIYGEVLENVNKQIEDLKKKFDTTTESIKKEGQELRQLYNEISKQNEDYIKEINNIKLTIEKIKLNKENHEKQLKTIDIDIQSTEDEIKNLSEKILHNIKEKENIEQHLDIINKLQTLVSRDFRGYLLSEIITYIDMKAKEYTQFVFNHNNIEFKLDGNDIDIYFNNKQYENLSGGEKQKIDLILQFSIRDMLVQFLDFSSNILVLDEIFDNLDDVGCQKVLDLISEKLSDIESIYIITHHKDISIPYDDEIIIVKDEKGISKIK